MIKNTTCQKCLFANKASSDNPCEHRLIEHLDGIKKMHIVDDYYVIEEYVCKMGFSKDFYEQNKDSISLEEIKQEMVDRACIRYYLLLDITNLDTKQTQDLCRVLETMDIKPSFISFLLFPSVDNKEKISILKESIDNILMWKAHSFIEAISIDDAIHIALDTNFGSNKSDFLLVYDPTQSDQLNNDINEINSAIIIDQKFFHYAAKSNCEGLNGLFLHFNNYQVCRSIDKNIEAALKTIPESIIFKYGNAN